MFIPRKFKTHKLVLWLFAAELPFVVVVLILTGIASDDTYTSKLWLDGSMNGFNSAPNQIVYALTNGQSYTTPIIWSSFLQRFNLVIGVLAVFLHLTKCPMHVLRILYPPISVAIHGGLTALFVASVVFQAGSDTTDSTAPQRGPPWYITKSCSVAYYKSDIGYCQQAKSLFAVSIILCVFYFTQFILGVNSCFSTKEEREAYRLRKEEKKEEQEAEERALREYEEILKSPVFGIPMTPASGFPGMHAVPLSPASGFPGMHPVPLSPHSPMMAASSGMVMPGMQPMYTPQPANDLPFRASNFSVPMSFQTTAEASGAVGQATPPPPQAVQTYFPPPPKAAKR